MTEKSKPLKEIPESKIDIKKLLKKRSSISKKVLLTKKSIRHSLDMRGLIQKKTFTLPQNNNIAPVDLCLKALDSLPKQRNNECLKNIISYLKSLPNFMNVLSKEKNSKISENLVEQISIHLRHEFIPKNNLVCRYGERGEKFYIILKGKVIFLIPRPAKCYLNLEEYILYLMQLRKNNEFELIDNLLVQNRIYYHIEDDNLDLYLLKEYEEYQNFVKSSGRKFQRSKTKMIPNRLITNRLETFNNHRRDEQIPSLRNIDMNINEDEEKGEGKKKSKKNQKKFFSPSTYFKMEELFEIMKNNNLAFDEDPFLGQYSPKYYLKSNNVINPNLESKGRKLVNIYQYEEMTTFENGQTFGFIALQNKNSKRAATAIVTEDSDLGVLSKDEYAKFFALLSNKEKKNLYDLLKFYNLITTVSEYKFVKRYYHMFEYIKYRKNNIIMEKGNKINDLIVFSSGLFIINISANIPELNELITKFKIIRGKLLGLSKYKIERQLDEKRENQDLVMRRNFLSEEDIKILLKRHNYTISIISDHLIIGYPDTVDPATHLPLFNCSCLSAESEGYFISKRSINLINEESLVIHNLKDYCLMKIQYNLNRLKQFKNEVISKLKRNEIPPPNKENKTMGVISNTKNNKERAFSENNINEDINASDITEEDNYYIERNQTTKKKSKDNSKVLLSCKFNDNMRETLNRYNKKKIDNLGNINSKSRNKINTIKDEENSDYFNQPKTYIIRKLRESIQQKQKKIELKKEQYFKIIEDINLNKKEKMKKTMENSISMNLNHLENSFNIKTTESSNNNDALSTNRIQKLISNNMFGTQKYINKDKINSLSYKAIFPIKKENLLTFPPIDKNKFNDDNYNMRNLKTESEIKIRSIETIKKQNYLKTNDFLSFDELNKKNYLSHPFLVKNKYIMFKSPHKPAREDSYTVDLDFIPKTKSLKPVRLKKDNHKKSNILNVSNNNDNEDKKVDYISFNKSQINQQNIVDNNIKEKYKELALLVKNLQKTTDEMLDKKEFI